MSKAVSLSQIGLYNPQRQNAKITEKLFVARQKQFELLMENLSEETKNSIPQHHLIIAQRGMGKTTMLKRMEVELHKKKYRRQFIPLLFPEEQYNISELAEFWLNSLNALADTLELEKYPAKTVEHIDNTIKEMMLLKKTGEITEKSYRFLMDYCLSLHRRPVLFVDNIGLVFSRLSEHEHHILRAQLSENGAPVIISAGVNIMNDVINYNAPFYDYFRIHYLKKLSFEEFVELLKNLSVITHSGKILSLIQKEIPRLKALHQLTGGNPRTTVVLFKLIVKGFSADINDDLDALLDEVTPLYKARFEELPPQQQIIIDAIALHWEAINLKTLSETTRYVGAQLSPQLKRLTEEGWIETTSAYKAKGNAYFISERFFNIWFLMRRSNRRQKKEIYCLSKFLESFYGKNIVKVAQNSVTKQFSLLSKAMIELSKRNEGIAKKYLLQSLSFNKTGLSEYAIEWQMLGSVAIKQGYGEWLLSILRDEGYDIILFPYYTAIQALEIEKNSNKDEAEIYLKNRAIEISEPARTIIEEIKQIP
jgi:glutamyl/glutaminyl-tRNA synthetase